MAHRPPETPAHALLLVQGDLGRSPRMQLHALCLGRVGVAVDLVGHAGVPVLPEVAAEPRVRVHAVATPAPHAAARGLAALGRVAARVAAEALDLGRRLRALPAPDLVLVQTPPAIPALALARLRAGRRAARLVIDWHNEGDALLALSLGPAHPLVRLHRGFERALARSADAHLCVSRALADELARRGVAGAAVLHDGPLEVASPLAGLARSEARGRLLARTALASRFADRPWVVCPSSHGRDDALDLLLEAARGLCGAPEVLVWVTGEGPGRASFAEAAGRIAGSRLVLHADFLDAVDYRALLRAADLGLCLHRSASGRDLPMKLAEMRGAGLPVAALDYGPVLDAALPPGAARFTGAASLRELLEAILLSGDAGRERLARIGASARSAPPIDFATAWAHYAAPLLGLRDRVYPPARG